MEITVETSAQFSNKLYESDISRSEFLEGLKRDEDFLQDLDYICNKYFIKITEGKQ